MRNRLSSRRLLPVAAAAALALAALPSVAPAAVGDPETVVSWQPEPLTNQTPVSIGFTGSDDIDGDNLNFDCSVDGGAAEPCVSGAEFAGLTDGAHTITITAIDQAGNRDASPAAVSFVLDTADPVAAIDTAPAAYSNGDASSLSVTFSSADTDVAGFECYLDGVELGTGCTSPAALPALADGRHYFEVLAIDDAGNRGDSATADFVLDHTAPTAGWVATPAAISNSHAAYLEFTGADTEGADTGTVTFSCSLDGAAFAACSQDDGVLLNDVSEGAHTFTVRTVDAAGNAGTPITHTFTTDYTAPSASIGGAATALSTDVITASGTGSRGAGDGSFVSVAHVPDDEAQFASPVEVGDATIGSDGTWQKTIGTLAPGSYRVYACQEDAAGNYGCPFYRLTVTAPAGLPGTGDPQVTTILPANPLAGTAKETNESVAGATAGVARRLETLGLAGLAKPSVVAFSAPGAGTVKIRVTTPAPRGMRHKNARKVRKPVVLAVGTKTVGASGVAQVKLTPTKAGKAAAKRRPGKAPRVRLTVRTTFTPTGGKPTTRARTTSVSSKPAGKAKKRAKTVGARRP